MIVTVPKKIWSTSAPSPLQARTRPQNITRQRISIPPVSPQQPNIRRSGTNGKSANNTLVNCSSSAKLVPRGEPRARARGLSPDTPRQLGRHQGCKNPLPLSRSPACILNPRDWPSANPLTACPGPVRISNTEFRRVRVTARWETLEVGIPTGDFSSCILAVNESGVNSGVNFRCWF